MGYEIDFRGEGGSEIKRLVWSTDLHFDAADRSQYHLFLDLVKANEPDSLLIGGDICNGVSCLAYLANLAKIINKPMYFVLGNHDFYYGSIDAIRKDAQKLQKEVLNVQYLSDFKIISLTEQTALIGHDGWSDAKAGDYFNSEVLLNDYFLIEELKRLNNAERFEKLNSLGKEAADYLSKQLIKALETYERVILLTHVPPFEESCLYEGIPAEGNWTPHFVGKATGEVLETIMQEHPNKQLLVLCGHSHWGQDIQILPNLRVITGHSELGIPNVQGIIYVN
jgi:Icc protein